MTEEATTEGTVETAAATPSVDFGPVFERMEQFGSKLEELSAAVQPPAPEQPDPYAELGNYYEDPNEANAARQALEAILNPALQAQTQPLLDKIAALEAAQQKVVADLELGDLEARYPRLANDEEYTNALLQEAQTLAAQLGNPALASNATLIEKLHLARMGAERAAAETPAGGVPTGLEAAHGASPGGNDGPDLAQSILRAGGQKTPGHLFWGA